MLSDLRNSASLARGAALLPGVAVALLGGVVLVGWAVDSETVKSLSPRFSEMKPNSAVGFICTGVALVLLQLGRRRRLGEVLAGGVLVLGVATLIQYAFSWELGIDELLFEDTAGPAGTEPGRMGVNTAFCFAVTGASLLLIDVERRGIRPAQVGAAIVFVVALVALLGYAFEAPGLETGLIAENLTPMALHTAAAFCVVSLGLFVARPRAGLMVIVRSEGAGGVLLRRLLLPALLLPVLLGYLKLEGQDAGLYGTDEGVALFASALIAVYGGLVLITARSLDRVDAERRAGAARERAVVETALHSIIAIDDQGHVLEFNPAAERTFGITREEALGRELAELIVPPRLREAHRRGLVRISETGEARVLGKRLELTGMRSDGSEFPVEVEVARLGRSDGAAFVGHLRDVTERVEAEQATSRLAAIVESSREAIIATELDGTIRAWNSAAEEIYGHTADEVLGLSVSLLAPPRQRGHFAHLFERVRDGESFEHEGEHVRKGGKRITASVGAFPIRGVGGQVIGAGVIVRDLSERKRLEAQLRQAQKMEAVGHLAGGVAHDFNNLLTVIGGFAHLAERRIGVGPGGQELGEIKHAVARAMDLTDKLLAYSRKQTLAPVSLDLNEVLGELVPMLARLIGEDVEIAVLADSRLPPVFADRGQVEQVVMNLAVNARDAMPDGGILAIETKATMLDERDAARRVDAESGLYACLSVTDTGRGIDPEIREHIFEPFYTTKDVGKGTGLGLASVHGIVAQSGGHVDVESEPGLGTTFRVYFPATDAPAEAPAAEADEWSAREAGSETILLCEDDDAVRRFLRTVLAEQGYSVLEASGPQQARELAHGHGSTIDVLVTDVVLPEISGVELAARLHESFAGLRVLFLSGYARDALDRRGLAPGHAFVPKPVDPATLLRALRRLLDGPRPVRQETRRRPGPS